MDNTRSNYAFIDGQNLNMTIQSLGWKLDFKRFRSYLRDRYNVERAFYFLGFIEGNDDLYDALKSQGYELIFKPTLENKDGSVKGNCDAELVLQAMIEFNNYDQAVIVSGDGDFYCLVDYLVNQNKLAMVLVPNRRQYSALLKKFAKTQIRFISDLRGKLTYTHESHAKDPDKPADPPTA